MLRYRRRPDVLDRRLRHGVVVASRDQAPVALNETGALVWDHLDGSRSVSELVERIAPLVDASGPDIHPEVAAFVERLRAVGLVTTERVEDGSGPSPRR